MSRAPMFLFEGAEVYLSELGPENKDTLMSAARIETLDGPMATTVLLTHWKGTNLAAGQDLLLGIVAENSFLQTRARVEEFLPPARIRLKILGKLEPTDRREFLRVSDYLNLGYRLVSAKQYPVCRLKVLNRHRVLVSRNSVSMRDRVRPPSMPPELEFIAARLDDIEAKIEHLLSVIQPAECNKEYSAGDKRLRWVNLSGSGMRFSGDLEVKKGDTIEVTIDLPLDPPVEVQLLARVLDAGEDNTGRLGEDRYLVSARFEVIHERERDDIIRYTFQRQRELLREQRRHNRPG